MLYDFNVMIVGIYWFVVVIVVYELVYMVLLVYEFKDYIIEIRLNLDFKLE